MAMIVKAASYSLFGAAITKVRARAHPSTAPRRRDDDAMMTSRGVRTRARDGVAGVARGRWRWKNTRVAHPRERRRRRRRARAHTLDARRRGDRAATLGRVVFPGRVMTRR
tara:strand:- start:607 stop:939 length:333 start_codon:yes stop_codon:yes gene_type:complete